MEKLIIENRTKYGMDVILNCIFSVIEQGKVSNNGKQHSYHSVFHGINNTEFHVTSFLNKRSERLVVHHNDGKDWQEE